MSSNPPDAAPAPAPLCPLGGTPSRRITSGQAICVSRLPAHRSPQRVLRQAVVERPPSVYATNPGRPTIQVTPSFLICSRRRRTSAATTHAHGSVNASRIPHVAGDRNRIAPLVAVQRRAEQVVLRQPAMKHIAVRQVAPLVVDVCLHRKPLARRRCRATPPPPRPRSVRPRAPARWAAQPGCGRTAGDGCRPAAGS